MDEKKDLEQDIEEAKEVPTELTPDTPEIDPDKEQEDLIPAGV